jgi:hypothetical protein
MLCINMTKMLRRRFALTVVLYLFDAFQIFNIFCHSNLLVGSNIINTQIFNIIDTFSREAKC